MPILERAQSKTLEEAGKGKRVNSFQILSYAAITDSAPTTEEEMSSFFLPLPNSCILSLSQFQIISKDPAAIPFQLSLNKINK